MRCEALAYCGRSAVLGGSADVVVLRLFRRRRCSRAGGAHRIRSAAKAAAAAETAETAEASQRGEHKQPVGQMSLEELAADGATLIH